LQRVLAIASSEREYPHRLERGAHNISDHRLIIGYGDDKLTGLHALRIVRNGGLFPYAAAMCRKNANCQFLTLGRMGERKQLAKTRGSALRAYRLKRQSSGSEHVAKPITI